MSSMVNGKYANNLKAPITVKDLIAKQKAKQSAHNNLKAPVAVKDIIAKQKSKTATLNYLRSPIKIKDLIDVLASTMLIDNNPSVQKDGKQLKNINLIEDEWQEMNKLIKVLGGCKMVCMFTL